MIRAHACSCGRSLRWPRLCSTCRLLLSIRAVIIAQVHYKIIFLAVRHKVPCSAAHRWERCALLRSPAARVARAGVQLAPF